MPDVELAALCDSDPKRLAECGLRRKVGKLYLSPYELLAHERIDIVSICTPPSVRREVVEAALDAGVRYLLCEKPVAADSSTGMAIMAAVRAAGATMAVPYLRRWSPSTSELSARIQAGELGTLRHVTVHYSNGLLSNGSHAIDYLNRVLGDARFVISAEARLGGSDHDPTIDCSLRYEHHGIDVPVVMVGLAGCEFSMFEIDLVGTKGRARLRERGDAVDVYVASSDHTFRGEQTLSLSATLPGNIATAMGRAVEELVCAWRTRGTTVACSVEDAVSALRIVEAIRACAQDGNRRAIGAAQEGEA